MPADPDRGHPALAHGIRRVIEVSDGPGRSAQGRVSVTMLGNPSQPRQVRAVADRDAGGQARVSWLPPTYDGGSSVSGYTVTHTGGSSGTTRARHPRARSPG